MTPRRVISGRAHQPVPVKAPRRAVAKPSGATSCEAHHIPFAYLRAGYPRAVYTRPTAGPTLEVYHNLRPSATA